MEATLLAITLLSIALAITASIVAWKVVSEERRRSEARIAALSAEIRGERGQGPPPLDDAGHALASDIFEAEREPATPSRTAAMVGAGAFATGIMIAIFILMGNGSSAPVAAGGETVTSIAKGLELLALDHERQDNQLIVRGTLNNLPAQSESDSLTAVVVLLGPDGGLVASTRATITPDPHTQDADGTFSVMVPNASEIGRYRVSFRRHNQVVSYHDRRTAR